MIHSMTTTTAPRALRFRRDSGGYAVASAGADYHDVHDLGTVRRSSDGRTWVALNTAGALIGAEFARRGDAAQYLVEQRDRFELEPIDENLVERNRAELPATLAAIAELVRDDAAELAATRFTLADVAGLINDARPLSVSHVEVERLGGNVYGVLDLDSGLGLTIDDGQRELDTDRDGAATVIVWREDEPEVEVLNAEARTAAEVAALFASVTA